jgi:N,N'-diacetylchitobiose phosphorylase
MNKQYGEFSRKGDEYIIYRPDTPKPWVHFLTNGLINSSISQSGEGTVTDLQSNNALPLSRPQDENSLPHLPARRIYIRDNDSGEYWDLGGQIVTGNSGHFEAIHAPTHTRIQRSCDEIDAAATFFLPSNDPCEIWQTTIRNNSAKKRRLSLFAALEWDTPNGHQLDISHADSTLIAQSRVGSGKNRFSFFACDRTTDSFDTREDAFLGKQSSYAQPLAIVDGRCSRSLGASPRPVAVLQKNLTLGAGSETELAFLVGAVWGAGASSAKAHSHAHQQIKRIIQKYRQSHAITSVFTDIRERYEKDAAEFLVKSPDPYFDTLTNYWVRREALVDVIATNAPNAITLAHLMTVAATDPDLARDKLIAYLAYQSHDGRLIDTATQTDISTSLVAAAAAYIRETGDLSILQKHVEYSDAASASVLHHLIRSLDFAASHLSSRHLPIQSAGLNIEAKAEIEDHVSACRIYQNFRELIPILDAVGEHELVRRYERHATHLKTAINEHFWDGGWYGNRITAGKKSAGFKKSEPHIANLASQAQAIVSHVAPIDRAQKIIGHFKTTFATKHGLASFRDAYPAASDDDRSIDAAGSESNGSIVPSENCDAVTAAALVGDGDEAYRLWQLSCPAYLAQKADHYQAEPFRYARFIYGPSHPLFGRGVSGRSTAASRMWHAAIQAILGIQPTLGGLKIDPCLPRDWRQVEVTRVFRGAEYHIRIVNSFRQNRGVDRILVDGVRITGTVIPPHASGVHFVEVVIG